MINYLYVHENNGKDIAKNTFVNSPLSVYPNLFHDIDLNHLIETIPYTRYRKQENFSYFHCDRGTVHLVFIPNLPILIVTVNANGTAANIAFENDQNRPIRDIPLHFINRGDSVLAFRGPITIGNQEYDLRNAFHLLLSDTPDRRRGNPSVTGYNI